MNPIMERYIALVSNQPFLGKEIGAFYAGTMKRWFLDQSEGSASLFVLDLPILQFLTKTFHLGFLPEHTDTGAVCFAENVDIRPQFRQNFTLNELLDYGYGLVLHHGLNKPGTRMPLSLPLPQNETIFWALAEAGGKLRQLHLNGASDGQDNAFNFISRDKKPVDNPFFMPDTSEGSGLEIGNAYATHSGTPLLGKVFVNTTDYFSSVPHDTWFAKIGGINPLQQYLKTVRGTVLKTTQIDHFKKTISIVDKTLIIGRKLSQLLDK